MKSNPGIISESKGQALSVSKGYVVYILELSDGRFYVGHTHDFPQRILMHEKGRGAKLTGDIGIRRVLLIEAMKDELAAIKRERQIKGWSRAKKLALANGDFNVLKNLARRRNR